MVRGCGGRRVPRSTGENAPRTAHPDPVYAGGMPLLILLVIVVAGFLAWRFRVKLIAKLTGQSEARINRQIGRRR